MKIAIITDTHLGFAWGTERQEDSFAALKEAFRAALKEKVDLVLLGGDIFDNRIPRPEVMARALDMFVSLRDKLKSKVMIVERVRQGQTKETPKEGVPAVISIYGTHERRPIDSINPMQILHKAGLLYNLHAESVLLKVSSSHGTGNIGVHGLSGVPDAYAKETFKGWNPKPFKGVKNFLLVHQTFSELVPAVLDDILSYADLPAGFDLFVLGHIHWKVEAKHPKHKTPILVPGSTVLTQQNKGESKQKKGFYIVDVKKGIEFKALTSCREFLYEEVTFEDKRPSEIMSEVDAKLALLLGESKRATKPIIRIKLKGTIAKGFMPTDLNFKMIIERYSDKALVSVDRSSVTSPDLGEHVQGLTSLKGGASIDEMGISILTKELERYGIKKDPAKLNEFFEVLTEGDLSKASEILKDF